MNREQYNEYRGWELPANENGDDDGFLVEYMDGGQANHPEHKGYISWSPLGVFERAYRPIDGMTFGMAIEAMKRGERLQRGGWNGKGMWVAYVGGVQWDLYPSVSGEDSVDTKLRDFIVMKTVDAQFVPWVASQTDMLAEDWRVVE